MVAKKENLTESQFEICQIMGFEDDLQTKNYDPAQIQYIAMSNYPQESWFITKPSRDALLHTLNAFADDPTQSDYSLDANLEFRFTRGEPKEALNPQTTQSIDLFSQPKSKEIVQNLTKALTKQCDET